MWVLTAQEKDRSQTDTQWIAALYEAYAARCLRAALVILRDTRLAEEAAQETWLKAVALARTAAQEDVERQLFTILKHTCLDILKKEKRYVALPEEWETAVEENGHRALLRKVARQIDALPEKYRQVLELKYLGEYTNREIARRLHLRESTVSTRVQRGREQLMAALKQEGYWDDGSKV
jgi:RNA polymerase sigma-70 factor (ECF subfamily)